MKTGEAVGRNRKFPVWKTIKLGTGLKTAADFRQALKASNCLIENWTDKLLNHFALEVSEKEREVGLVKVTPRTLGFESDPTPYEIWAVAQRQGLELLPIEAGFQLRLQYLDQPLNEVLWLGTELELGYSYGNLRVWRVGRHDGYQLKDGLWLMADYFAPSHVRSLDMKVLFGSRK